MELAALQNVSVWRRTPWNAVPKMALAPANLVTKATDARKPVLLASGDWSASSPVDPVRMKVSATKELETSIVLLVTQEKPVPHDCHSGTVDKHLKQHKSVLEQQLAIPNLHFCLKKKKDLKGSKRLSAIAKSIVEMSNAIPVYAQFNEGERMLLCVCMQLVRPISTAQAACCTTSVMIVLRGTLILARVPACPTGPSLMTDACLNEKMMALYMLVKKFGTDGCPQRRKLEDEIFLKTMEAKKKKKKTMEAKQTSDTTGTQDSQRNRDAENKTVNNFSSGRRTFSNSPNIPKKKTRNRERERKKERRKII
ncbi:uncharacterized protein LOC144302672 [Canis aureus]